MDIDDILEMDDPAEMVMEIEALLDELTEGGTDLDPLTGQQRVFYYCQRFDGAMNNGGFQEFFTTELADSAADTVDGLRRVGADQLADLLDLAIELWPGESVPEALAEREPLLAENRRAWQPQWEKLEKRYLRYPDELEVLLIDFVADNQASF